MDLGRGPAGASRADTASLAGVGGPGIGFPSASRQTRIGTIAIALLAWSQVAVAGSVWSAFGFRATSESAPKVLAAAEKLMTSAVGQEFSGRLLLQSNVANGADPAAHSFVPVYADAAAREAFVMKLQADKAWAEFQKTMTKESEPVSQTTYRVVQRWGDIQDSDGVWMLHAFTVRDAGKFVAALNALMASPTGQRFPGQVYLSEVIAGGITPVTHVISVGYASEAEMFGWFDVRDPSPDWANYLDASGTVADYLGANLARTVKFWGPASLASREKNGGLRRLTPPSRVTDVAVAFLASTWPSQWRGVWATWAVGATTCDAPAGAANKHPRGTRPGIGLHAADAW